MLRHAVCRSGNDVTQPLLTCPERGVPAGFDGRSDILICIVDQQQFFRVQTDPACHRTEERWSWLAMANRGRVVATIDVRSQTKCVHEIARSFMLLIRRKIGAKSTQTDRSQVSQQLLIQSSVLPEPIGKHLVCG